MKIEKTDSFGIKPEMPKGENPIEPLARPNLASIKPYKPGKPIEEVIRELKLTGKVIKLASNENPLGTSPKALHAMQKALSESYLYPDDNAFYLKQKLAEKHNVNLDNIIIGNGSVELIYFACLSYLNPYERLMRSSGSFLMAKIGTEVMGSVIQEIPLKDYCHDLDRMASAITPQTKIIYLDNPINPLGTAFMHKDLEKFLAKVPDYILVIIDEAYYDYITTKDYPDSFKFLNEGKNVLILRTFSKIHGLAGLRIGYGISKPEIINALMKVRTPFNASRIAQIGAIAALDDVTHIKRSRKVNEIGKRYLYKELRKLNLFFLESYANFIFVNFATDSQLIFDELQKRGVITRTIKEYGFPNALRISIGTPAENKRLIRALSEVLKA
ncbi:MAG: histidinol-phosphate transaminase [candidate division WOR-3 bacterium]